MEGVKHIKILQNFSLAQKGGQEDLLEVILTSLEDTLKADGIILYKLNNHNELHFENVHLGHKKVNLEYLRQKDLYFNSIKLYDKKKFPNLTHLACYTSIKNENVIVEDIYNSKSFDFTQNYEFDEYTGFKTYNILSVPICNQTNKSVGVIQLLNVSDEMGHPRVFDDDDSTLANFYAFLTGMALTNLKLTNDLKLLFESFVEVLAQAIDQKSPYTRNHCRRVPKLALMLADAINDVDYGPLKDFKISADERYELELATFLHDCGKIVTPLHIMDKSLKLERIIDGMEVVKLKMEIFKKDMEILCYKEKIKILQKINKFDLNKYKGEFDKLDRWFLILKKKANKDLEVLSKANVGQEWMNDEDKKKVKSIYKKYRWPTSDGGEQRILTYEEFNNLLISRGTLNLEEREIINNHAAVTVDMLEQIHFPEYLKNIPKIAGGHHERMDGKGYPKGLTKKELPVLARVMGLADVYEALTASDRPYKRGKTISESMEILKRMKDDGAIDPDIFTVFINEKIYLKYAMSYLDRSQIDDIDESLFLETEEWPLSEDQAA